MLEIRCDRFVGFRHEPQNDRVRCLIEQPYYRAVRVQEATDRTQHLPNEFLRLRRGGQNVQALRQRLRLSAGDLLGSAQSFLNKITLDRDTDQMRGQLDKLKIFRGRSSRCPIVKAKGSEDLAFERENWTRPGGSQPMLQR